MAQHDYNIANQSGADFRADLNNALLAIATVNSGSTEPSTTFAHQLWVDTSSSVLKIRNAADNAWITTGVSITASNTFTGDLTGDVTGNLTGNVTGNVTGDLTGNADSADTLSTARTISLSGDVVGSVSFDGSTNIDIDTVVQINSITLGTDTTGDYVESLSGGTGVTVTGGTGEGSTPSVAIGQSVATTDNVTFNLVTATDEFVGDLDGAIRFTAKADEALSKGDVVYVSGVSGNTTTVGKAKADDASKMPAFGMAVEDANANNNLQIVTFGNLTSIDTSNESVGEILYVSTTAGEYTTTAPTGESAAIQNIGKILRSHQNNGSIKVGGAGRSNATPNLDDGKIFIGNGSNQSVTSTLDTSIVVENTNLYYTTARANTDFDTRLATKDTGDLTEGSNLYYTTARVNSDFDTRLATKSTTDLTEGTNLYYTTARFDSAFTSKDTDDLSEGTTNLYYTTTRFDSAFSNKTTADLTENTNLYYTDTRANSAIDTRVTKAFVDALGIQASSVDANSVTLGTDTVGNYIQTVTGTANKITVSGSGSESADITLSLPDDVQIASDLTVAGNLTVNGTLTSLDTTNLDIEDNLFQLNAGLTGSPVNDSGMLINRGNQDNGIFMWDESVDKFTLGLTTADGSATGNITLNSLGTLVANLEGNVTGQVSDISNFTTANLTENTNLYYTDARSRAAISATGDISYNSSTGVISFTQSASPVTSVNTQTGAVVLDTDDIGEGSTNVYFTNARADTRINLQTGANLDLSSKSTSDLSEGSNLYYTDARARASISEDSTQLSYNSTTGVLSYTQGDTDTVSEGTTNLYYTDARANSAIDTRVTKTFVDALNVVAASATGNAGTSTALATARDFSIAGDITASAVSFDGTGNVALSASIDANTVGISEINVTDGTSGQVLTTDGAGNLSFTTASGTTINNNADNRVITGSGTANTLNGESNFVFDGTNVGIGTTATDGMLTIKKTGSNIFGDSAITIQSADTNQSTLALGLTGSVAYVDSTESGSGTVLPLVFATGSTEKMRIDSSGMLLVNTTSSWGGETTPHIESRGDVAGDYTGLIVSNTNDAASDSVSVNFGLARDGGLVFGNAGKITVGKEQDWTSTPSTIDSFMSFSTYLNESLTEKMRIDSSGNVGIGTDSPARKVQIQDTSSTVYLSLVGPTNAGAGIMFGDSDDETVGRVTYDNSNNGMQFWTNDSERMRIDSSGNVGIGTSSPATQFHLVNADDAVARIESSGSESGDDARLEIKTTNGTFTIQNDRSLGTSGALTFAGNTSNNIVIDHNSGNVGIGTSSPAYTLDVNGNIGVGTTSTGQSILQMLTSTTGTGTIHFGDGGGNNLYAGYIQYAHASNSLQFGTSHTEKMRLNSAGQLLIGQTSTVGSETVLQVSGSDRSGGVVGFYDTDASTSIGNIILRLAFTNDDDCTNASFIHFADSGGTIGSVYAGNANSVVFSTVSDERLKENIVDASSQLQLVKDIKVREFDWKKDGTHQVGFIAQELNNLVPEAVAEGGEDVTENAWGVDYGKLTPYLVKAIQEQQAQIEALQSEINLLKGE